MEWWKTIGNVNEELPLVTFGGFQQPSAEELKLISGYEFREAMAKMSNDDDRQHFKVIAALLKVDVRFGPLYYDACTRALESSGRVCSKQLEADGMCPRCGPVDESMPYLLLNKASFVAQDGAKFKATAFGDVAGTILDISAAEAKRWEEKSINDGDANRAQQAEEIKGRLEKPFELAVKVDHITLQSGDPYLSVTIYHAAAVVAPAPSSSDAKRARLG